MDCDQRAKGEYMFYSSRNCWTDKFHFNLGVSQTEYIYICIPDLDSIIETDG
jgi:hypothetical protein